MSDPLDIDIEFTNGRLIGHGCIKLHGSEFVGVNDDGSTRERSEQVVMEIERGEIVYDDGGSVDVEPGRYIVTGEGLFREVDAPAD